MRKKASIFFYLMIHGAFIVFAQQNQYQYSRSIDGITDEWHKISLPDELFDRLRDDLHDIRIVGINEVGDTVEAPYILKSLKDKSIRKEVQFKRINDAKRGGVYYVTFELPELEAINEINLDFGKKNFDWRIKLEGSQDQVDWFELLNDYRILSIQNNQTDYSFTTLSFAPSNYRYIRLQIKSETAPRLQKASINHTEIIEGSPRNYDKKALIIHEENNQTILDISLKQKVPVSSIKIDVTSEYDYYRPITIQYLADSFETEKGWKYNYITLKRGTLSSLEDNELNFSTSILRQIRIVVENHDNEPLEFADCQVWDYERILYARFTEKANFFMIYGNPSARKPKYDIAHFADQIPKKLSSLQLGMEQEIQLGEIYEKKPLFENKAWLWAVLLVIIALLAYFSMQMIKKR